jgi:hypothetical protein
MLIYSSLWGTGGGSPVRLQDVQVVVDAELVGDREQQGVRRVDLQVAEKVLTVDQGRSIHVIRSATLATDHACD